MVFRNSTFILALLLLVLPRAAASEPISLVAVGDLLLGGSATDTVRRSGFDYPFQATGALIRQADFAMANLEAPLTDRGTQHPDKTFTFRVPPEAAGQIRLAGFDLMTLANNHVGDYGVQGLLDTLESLEGAGLGVSGAGRDLQAARAPYVKEINGYRFAFLSYSNTFPKSFYAKKDRPGTAPGYFDDVAADIKSADSLYDHVIVSFHWGGERMNEPKDYQVELGRLAIDSGADVVIGHHPHVLQGAELYHGGVIYYSLGNYAFGSYSQSSVTAGMARVWFEEGRLIKAEILPLNVFNLDVRFQPKPLLHGPGYAFARDFNDYSEPFNTRLERQPGPFWEIVEVRKTEDRIQGTGEMLAQGQKPSGHREIKVTGKGARAF